MGTDTFHDGPLPQRSVVDAAGLPSHFPTHLHDGWFGEALGCAAATFGFLEEVLGKATFAFTGTRPIGSDQLDEAYAECFRLPWAVLS